jgi:hypothetical protein
MLKPLRLKRLLTLNRTPGWFSTRKLTVLGDT